MIDILRFLLIITVWLFIWMIVPLSCAEGDDRRGRRIVRAVLILASMLIILWCGI